MQAPTNELIENAKKFAALAQYRDAYLLLTEIYTQIKKEVISLSRAETNQFNHLLWLCQPAWWSTVKHGKVSLRRCQESDANFYQTAFANDKFTKLYCPEHGWIGSMPKALANSGSESPPKIGSLQWVVCFEGRQVGLASLNNIDGKNFKAEFSIGFPSTPMPGVAHKASLLAMHFAYFMVGLNKLYTLVYTYNEKAKRNTERLGLLREGTLTDHYFISNVGFASVIAYGLTKKQAMDNKKLTKIVKRCINKVW
jgi:RimJ/RimL family protein N-acetyltransferase